MKGFRILFSNESSEWCTPLDLFQDIKDAFQIELDPCAHDEVLLPVKISLFKKDNGLLHEWKANTYVNPPYSSIELWVDKVIDEHKKNPTCNYVMLLPSRTDRPWYRKVLGAASAVCFISKRLRFSNAKNNAPFPSLMAVFKEGSFSDGQINMLEKYGYTI